MRAGAAMAMMVAALAVPPAGPAKEEVPACAATADARGPSGLPAPLLLETRCAGFQLRTDGSVRQNGRGILSHQMPRGSIAFGDGTWWHVVQGRLTVNRAARVLWSSNRRYPRPFGLEGAAVGANAVAFTYRSRLFVAARGHRVAERPVGLNERPLGWSRDGLLFTSGAPGDGGGLGLRASDGSFLAVVRSRPRAIRFDPATQTVLMVTRHGRVERFDGRSIASLGRLRELGMPVWSWIEPLAGGLVAVTSRRRVTILEADGSRFASATFPAGRRWNAAGNSGLVADPHGRAVALTLTEGNTGYASRGAEWLLVLRRGDRVARVLHREALRFAVCERWTMLSWRDAWLLYSSIEGRTLALDTARRRVVDLSAFVARLPGAKPDGQLKVELQARWTSS